jgi:hypothetical protein
MAKRWTKPWLRDYEIPRLEKVLKSGRLASVDEIAALADQYKGGAFADHCEWCRKLSTFARRQEWHAREHGDDVAEAVWKDLAVLADLAEPVELRSIKERVTVTPASMARIMVVEDCDWWLLRLLAARMVLKADADKGNPIEDLDETLGKIRDEIAHTRSILFGEVVARTPAPADQPVDWADKITPLEESQLLQAWHTVNTDLLKRLKAPVSKRDGSALPPTWSMVFQSIAWLHNKYPRTIIRDWSLVAVCASNVIEAIKQDDIEKRSKRKAH